MADKFNTMKLLDIRRVHLGYEGVYECQVCQGMMRGREVLKTMGDECFEPDTVAGMTCALCDEQAHLSERYWMAMSTLALVCMTERGRHLNCADWDFPSFKDMYVDPEDDDYFAVKFDMDGVPVEAQFEQIGTNLWHRANRLQQLENILDGVHDQTDPRLLALEVVNRVRHDLKAAYGIKEA